MTEDLPRLETLVRQALAEDIGTGDVTTAATVDPSLTGRARIVARQPGVVAGLEAAVETYRQVDPAIGFESRLPPDSWVEPDQLVAVAEGLFSRLLVAERIALNFVQRLSGIATMTARFVDAVDETQARIVDTRKTTPGWRALEKNAVVVGGGYNHRKGLYDEFLIKENHIAGSGGIEEALTAVAHKNKTQLPVELEVRTLSDVEEALASAHRPDRLLCDNFDPLELSAVVEQIRAEAPEIVIEASGGISLARVKEVADTGVDWISIGALTHSSPALDLSCLIQPS